MSAATYDDIKDDAIELLRIVRRQARRGFVLEVTGTPKAGKTTSIAMIESFFKTCGWRVHVLTERAAQCPLKMKGHFFFNAWTTCTMLAEFLDLLDREIDLVILDRGFFDALIWLELQRHRGQLEEAEQKVFREFVLLRRWQLTDAVALLQVDPAIALEREHRDKLIPRKGSVMRESALREFNECVTQARSNWTARDAPPIIDVHCESTDQKHIVGGLIRGVLPRIRNWTDPTIAAVPQSIAREMFGRTKLIRWVPGLWERIMSNAVVKKRSVFEEDPEFVQLVACGATMAAIDEPDRRGVFVFDRKGTPIRYGRRTIFHRCHISASEPPDEAKVACAIQQRLRDLLHVRDIPQPTPLGLVWDATSEIETKHMGVCFNISLSTAIADSLMEKEFKTSGRGHPMTSTFALPEDLRAKQDLELEPWSKAVLDENWL